MAGVKQSQQVHFPYITSRLKLCWILLLACVGLTLILYFCSYSSPLVWNIQFPRHTPNFIKNALIFKEKAQFNSSRNMVTSAAKHEKESSNKESKDRAILIEDVKSVVMNGILPTHENKTHPESISGDFSWPISNTYRTRILESLVRLGNTTKAQCSITSQFNSWKKGVVTQMGMPIKHNCQKLSFQLESEVLSVQAQVKKWVNQHPWETFAQKFTSSCDTIREEFSNNFYVSRIEKNFPIAYILVIYTNAGQMIRLLKSIYRPQNTYCINPDAKQKMEFTNIFGAISRCLDNVFVVSRPISVYYGHHTIMDAQLNCMDDLMKRPKDSWKYMINLCGREVPLKTNREIVESLIKLKGYSAVLDSKLITSLRDARFKFKFILGENGAMHQSRVRNENPPSGIELYKSMNFLAASYAFVDFILTDNRVAVLRNYLKSGYAPEEHFYSSLYELPDAKGAKPNKSVITSIAGIPRVDQFIWTSGNAGSHLSSLCPGRKVVHSICILTTPDMKQVLAATKQTSFFFNKYFLELDPTVMDCMEEMLVRTNIKEYWKDCIEDSHKY